MFGRSNAKAVSDFTEAMNEALGDNQLRDKIRGILHPEAEFTPDLWMLEQKKSHLVFIHDDMMQTQPNHSMVQAQSLSGFYPFCYGYTARRYSFVKKNLGLQSFPIALNLRETDNLPYWMADSQRLRGEVYAIRTPGIIALDNHRQNGVQFERLKVMINIGHRKNYKHTTTDSKGIVHIDYSLGKEEMTSVMAYMYVGREDYWKDQLEAGFFDFTPVPIVEEDRLWLKTYYQYNRVR